MSRLGVLLAPQVYAAALAQAWPDDPVEQVRCLDAGTRSLGLDTTCAPWSRRAEDAALADELGVDAGDATFDAVDEITGWLVATPGAPGVLGLITGPTAWSARVSDDPDALDIASDLAAARVRSLASSGVGRLVVVECPGQGSDAVAEAHQPILRAAEHLRVEVTLVGSATPLGYDRWASPTGSAGGLGYLPPAAFDSTEAVSRHLDQLAGCAEIVSGPLGASTSPDVVRHAAQRGLA